MILSFPLSALSSNQAICHIPLHVGALSVNPLAARQVLQLPLSLLPIAHREGLAADSASFSSESPPKGWSGHSNRKRDSRRLETEQLHYLSSRLFPLVGFLTLLLLLLLFFLRACLIRVDEINKPSSLKLRDSSARR